MKSFNVLWLSSGLVALPVAAAIAQEPQEQGRLEEIVVTAQKREQSAQDTPVAVTVLTGDSLVKLGIESGNDVAQYTPGLAIAPVQGVGNVPNISIRGVGLNDFRDFNESPSAVYVDEVYKGALAGLDFALYDLERVEVLKGPQGTMFGRNATGGLVNYLTRRPSDTLEGYARLSGGSYGDIKVEAAVGGPLSDAVSGRLSAIYHTNDGVRHNVNPDGKDGDQIDLAAARGQLDFKLSDAGSLLLSLETGRNDNAGGNPYRYAPALFANGSPVVPTEIDKPNRDVVVGTSDLNDINVSGGLKTDTKFNSATARLGWDFGAVDLVSITNYQDFDKHQVQDCDSSPADFCFTDYTTKVKQFSEEVRLQGEIDKLLWNAGLYYFNLNNKGAQSLFGPIAGFFIAPGTDSTSTTFDTTTTSWAAFGQLEYRITDDVALIGGLRYTDNKTDMTQVFLKTVPEDALGFTGGVPYPKETLKKNNVSYTAKVAWDVSDATMVYAGISNSFKGGTFNSGFGPVDPSLYSVKPEDLTSFEIGFKSESGDRRNRLSGAAFYYDYKDMQAFQFVGLNQLLFNADATVKGAELEWTGLPVDALEISAGLGYLDTTVKKVADSNGVVKDREMVLAPGFSMNAMGRYTWDLSGGSALAAQVDGNYNTSVYFDNINAPGTKQGSVALFNARLSWNSTDDRYEVAAYCKNLTDEVPLNYAFDLSGQLGYVQQSYHPPRTYGVSVGVKF
ncbi:MAG: TonB-dependent receptor [Gammaproteobacteria bacterium]|nr:TonB-dependent receptor [Gammaproteobacteria bacterium]MDH4256504.1 TonB-dependent receptor [Gammaproteobacteria bacterium]